MKSFKPFFYGAVIGILIGLWFGVNIGKHKPFYSNPFAPANIEGILKDQGGKIIQKSGELLEKGGQAIGDQGEKIRGKMEQ